MSTSLEWLWANVSRIIAGAALATVASVAGVVSYTHIDALTLALGGSAMAGHLMPFGVDGQMVVGSVVLMTATGSAARWGWLGIGLGMVESLFANFESGISHGPLAAGWYAVPALSFAVATFTLERWAKAQVATVSHPQPGGRTEKGPDAEGGGETDANPCSHYIASSAEESATQAWLHARDCLHEPLSQRQVSAAFQISRTRVAELVAPYLPAEPIASVNGSGPHA